MLLLLMAILVVLAPGLPDAANRDKTGTNASRNSISTEPPLKILGLPEARSFSVERGNRKAPRPFPFRRHSLYSPFARIGPSGSLSAPVPDS